MLTSFNDSVRSAVAACYMESQAKWGPARASSAVIHQQLLPCNVLSFEGVECSAMCRQAEWVGGDFYDFLALQNGELGIAIGDVCGKGLPAALMMANLQATLRAEIRHAPADLSALMTTVNRFFYESSLEHFYSTLFLATFDPVTRMVKYVNSGHPPPMIVREKHSQIEWLNCGGPPIGMFNSCTYSIGSSMLNAGDVMIAYTDGIVESPNVSSEQWGVERLMRTVMAGNERTSLEFNLAIVSAVDGFSHGVKDRDDMALVVLHAL